MATTGEASGPAADGAWTVGWFDEVHVPETADSEETLADIRRSL